MEISTVNYVLALCGYLLYVLMAMFKSKRSHKDQFKILIWLSDNFIALAISAVSVVTLMMFLPDIIHMNLLPKYFDDMSNGMSVVFGYFNVSILKKSLDIAYPKQLKKG